MADGNRKAVWEDIMDLPEKLGAEIFGGKIYYKAMPRPLHGGTHLRLGALLDPATRLGLRTGWYIANEVDIALSVQDFARPDVAGWRLTRITEGSLDEWPTTLLPDWVCEILSPSNARYDKGTKMTAYAQAGVPWMWIADPAQKTVEVFELVASRWTLVGCYGVDDTLAMPPFDETVVVVADLFPELPPALR